jgi:CBS-domain-containing membrane protein|eukprot:1548616-Prymnesium_polylepis.1
MGRLRLNLIASCKRAPGRCVHFPVKQMNALDTAKTQGARQSALALKQVAIMERRIALAYWQSTFCLQPVGDRFTRKGVVDSLLLGCIPVIFHEQTSRQWPWHWESWWENATLMLDLNKSSSTEFDVVDVLQQVQTKQIEAIQSVIAARAHLLQCQLQFCTVKPS